MSIRENLEAIMLEFDINQDGLARLAEVYPSTVSGWMNGSMPRPKARKKLCKALNITEDDIISERSGMAAKRLSGHSITTSGFVEVPLLGSIAAGTPMEMVETDESHPVPAKVMEKYPDAKLLKVKGNSMNRILPDGCYALVDPCEEVERDNQPYAVCVNGHDATIKRVHKLENGFELVPDSTDPTFKSQLFDYGEPDTETITVIGRVVYHVLPFDWSY